MRQGPSVSMACALLVVCAGAAFSQNNNGRISGTVSDSSGAVIPGANVVVTNQATKLTWKAATSKGGFYVVTNLPVGTFDVEVDATGFRKAKQTGFELVDAGRVTANFKLEVGEVTQSIVVQEVLGETVNTVSGELGNVIDHEQVQDLALNGRNYMQLVSLVPGVALLDEDQMGLTTSLSITAQSVNGTRTNTSNLMVDGGSNVDSGSNGSQINNVGVDFIREMVVQTSPMSAEFGRSSGATINAVTKGGGNSFHGGLLYTIRNDALDAKDYFAPRKPILRFHDYSWNLGGPIAGGPLKKGKFFFFAGQEWKKIRKFTSPSRKTLPTLAELDGDFSDRVNNNIRYPGTTLPIPDKNLAPLMTADGKAVMNVYRAMISRAALYTNRPGSNNATYQVLNPFNWRQDIVRIDYTISDKQSLYFRRNRQHIGAVGVGHPSGLVLRHPAARTNQA
ncbi:MAG: Plug and carboxypeptidase regulatory-like domain-containing protein, partial [Acidobacteria bacterium]|nr:Plug and carboxypeptidase regulatory-like domain-containing protein [Acidobacteriota bacterium]